MAPVLASGHGSGGTSAGCWLELTLVRPTRNRLPLESRPLQALLPFTASLSFQSCYVEAELNLHKSGHRGVCTVAKTGTGVRQPWSKPHWPLVGW